MEHLAEVTESITAHECAHIFINLVFCFYDIQRELDLIRDIWLTAAFFQSVFHTSNIRLKILTYDHPDTDYQRECSDRNLKSNLRGTAQILTSWIKFLPMVT